MKTTATQRELIRWVLWVTEFSDTPATRAGALDAGFAAQTIDSLIRRGVVVECDNILKLSNQGK